MNNNRFSRYVAILFMCQCFTVPALVQAQTEAVALTTKMIAATNAFIDTLSPQQKQVASYAFDDEERLNWHFIPRDRNGISFNDLDDDQRIRANEMLQAILSEQGNRKITAIRGLENVLREIETDGRFVRDPQRYYFTVFGTPSLTEPWAFRFEGHHIALNWTFVAGAGVASTPQFFGANPAEVRQGPQRGLRVLAREEDLARSLVQALNTSQQSKAILAGPAPRDIFTAAENEVSPLDSTGLSMSEMDPSLQQQLTEIVTTVAESQPPSIASHRMQQFRSSDPESIRFTWIGSTQRGAAHYYRIQTPDFLIEYDNTQNDANHIHLVWRDFNGDFGRDLIRLHYDAVASEFGGHIH